MLMKNLIAVFVSGLLFAFVPFLNAQEKPDEKKDQQTMTQSEDIQKCMDKISSDSTMRMQMMDKMMENYIVITTEYYWHWDLKGTGLNVWEYRKVMEKMMNAGGLEYYATDDPEISSHPANCLMARIGKNIDAESVQKFDALRFHNRFMY